MNQPHYPHTPDGRYFVAKGRLWRRSDPNLDASQRTAHVRELMQARRAVKDATDECARREAHTRVHAAKVALGERGPVWWSDQAPDESRYKPEKSRYAAWWAGLDAATRAAGRD